MIILAIDLSADPNVLAIVDGAIVLAQRMWHPEFRNNQALFRQIRDAAEAAGQALEDIGAFAVGLGPGSFTGVRCGVAAARALGMPGNVPVIGVSSAEVIARDVAAQTHSGTVVVAGDARRQRIWHAEFRLRDDELGMTKDFRLSDVKDFPGVVPDGATVVSPDADRIGDTLRSLTGVQAILEPRTPTAERLAERAWQILDQGSDIPLPVPIYLHPPVFVEPRFSHHHANATSPRSRPAPGPCNPCRSSP